MKTKQILTACLISVSASINAAISHLVVEQKSGEKYVFLLNDKPVISFAGSDLVVNGNKETSYTISSIKNYHFEENLSNQEQMAQSIQIATNEDGQIEVSNMEEGTDVVLLSSTGAVLSKTKANTNGAAYISLPLQNGVYIISAGKKSFKIVKN